jgi:hypothetical protein
MFQGRPFKAARAGARIGGWDAALSEVQAALDKLRWEIPVGHSPNGEAYQDGCSNFAQLVEEAVNALRHRGPPPA